MKEFTVGSDTVLIEVQEHVNFSFIDLDHKQFIIQTI